MATATVMRIAMGQRIDARGFFFWALECLDPGRNLAVASDGDADVTQGGRKSKIESNFRLAKCQADQQFEPRGTTTR